jgi:hypothetical protein
MARPKRRNADMDKVLEEAVGWAHFVFALQCWHRLDIDDGPDEQLPDEDMARDMIRKCLRSGASFDNPLMGTEMFLERRYDGAPPEIVQEAMIQLRKTIDRERDSYR